MGARKSFQSVGGLKEVHSVSTRRSRASSEAGEFGIPDMVLAWVYAQAELGEICSNEYAWTDASRHYEAAFSSAPAEIKRQIQLRGAWCAWQLGEFDRSDSVYSSVLEDDSLCQHALLDRARMRIRLRLWADALTDLEMATALGDDAPDIANDRGVCHFEMVAFERSRTRAHKPPTALLC